MLATTAVRRGSWAIRCTRSARNECSAQKEGAISIIRVFETQSVGLQTTVAERRRGRGRGHRRRGRRCRGRRCRGPGRGRRCRWRRWRRWWRRWRRCRRRSNAAKPNITTNAAAAAPRVVQTLCVARCLKDVVGATRKRIWVERAVRCRKWIATRAGAWRRWRRRRWQRVATLTGRGAIREVAKIKA